MNEVVLNSTVEDEKGSKVTLTQILGAVAGGLSGWLGGTTQPINQTTTNLALAQQNAMLSQQEQARKTRNTIMYIAIGFVVLVLAIFLIKKMKK